MKKIDLKSKVVLLTKFSWTCYLLLSYIIFSIGFWLIGMLILPNLYYLFVCIGLTLFICSIFLLRILLRKYDNNKLNKLKNTDANIDSQIPSINGIRKDEDNIKKFDFLENPLFKKITIGFTLTFIIAFTIVMFAMGATIKKQSKEIWINDVCYFLNEEMYYEVSRCNDSNQIVIENEINEIPVKKITIDAFDTCSSLTSIIIPSNITKIDDSAFDKCLSLKNVYYYGINPFNNSIDISVNDSPLQEATWYYYNENKSNYTVGNWWYFDIDGKTIIAYSNYDMTNINFNDVSYIYDGQAKNISLTGELPNGVSVKYYCNNDEFNGAIDVGVYDVTAKFTSSNDIYKAPKDMKASLTIEKGTYNLSNINFNDVSYIYDGETKNIFITGELPNGVSVKYYCNNDEFNGAVDAGVYDVTAKFTSSNNNYESIDEMKASLTIEKGTYDLSNINFNDVSYIYDGQAKNISITGELPNGVSVKYYCNNDEFNGAIDVGVYDVTAKFTSSNNNYESIDEMKATLTIEKGTYDLSNINFNDVSYIYDGQAKNISLTGELPNGVSVKYYCNNDEFNGAIDVGVYDVTAKFTSSNNNYESIDEMKATLTIEKGTYDLSNINFNDVSYIYDGETKNISITGELPNGVSVKYYCNNDEFNGAVDVGVYDVTAKFTSSNNNYESIDEMKATLTIEKGTYDLSNINFNDVSYIYDGQTKNISLTGELPNGVSVKYYCNNDEFNGAIDAGVYDVTAEFTSSNNNYESIDEMKASLTIEKATYDLSNINFNDVSYIYDGQAKNIFITGELPNGVSVKYYCNNDEFNGAVDAGVYDVTAKFTSSNKNYESIDEMKASLTIEKATCDLSNIYFNDVSYIYDGQTKNISITGELPNGVSVKYYCNNDEFNGAVDAGVYDVTAEFIINENNYNNPLTLPLSAKITIYDSSAFTLINDSKTATLNHAPDSTSLDIPNYIYFNDQLYEINSIGEEAFKNCSSLTSITIPNSVTSIGAGAFYDCSSLTSITIPNSVTSIGEEAFYNCSSLTSITIPNGVTSIGDSTFRGCSSLTSITIPNSVTSIGAGAFYDCSSLTSITIPNSVTSIDINTFRRCSSLTSITIPNSVTSIGAGAFMNCFDLTSITIPNSVTSIGDDAFYYCSSLTSITIPNSVTSIGDSAFGGCLSLTSITIPNGVTSIGDYAFRSCSSLTSITIPNSVTSIGDYTFENCSSLTSITIPNSVTSIGKYVFKNCSNLTSVIFEENSQLTSIGNVAFYKCSSLTSITIPNSVTSIGVSVFKDCSSLTSVIFEENSQLTSIGDSAFYNCNDLTSIIFEDDSQLTSIGDHAFEWCSSLTFIIIPKSVTSIGNYAFNGCSNLTDVYFQGTDMEWNTINTGIYNTYLTNANKHYYSETKPTNTNLSYWHYDTDGKTPILWTNKE